MVNTDFHKNVGTDWHNLWRYVEIFCENPCYCDKLQRLLKEIDTDNMLLEEAKSLD